MHELSHARPTRTILDYHTLYSYSKLATYETLTRRMESRGID